MFLECLLHDVNHEYAAPVISQQGEVTKPLLELTVFFAPLSLLLFTASLISRSYKFLAFSQVFKACYSALSQLMRLNSGKAT